MSKDDVKRLTEVAEFTPKQWESKVRQLCVEAKNAGTIDGWWRDRDRATPAENRRRMKGKLDFDVYLHFGDSVEHSVWHALPRWKRAAIALCMERISRVEFTVFLEAKTGRGKPNAAQLVSIERANRNPGAHAFVVYPYDLPWLRAVLGI